MMTVYPACFYKEKDGNYSVIFPDLNHLATCGDSIENAVEMAIDCLAGYVYTAKAEKRSLPEPSDMSSIDINAEYDEYESAFINIVAVDVEEYAKKHFEKSVKKTLTIPAWLNNLAEEKNINFSKTLQEALISKLNVG
ncbi:MAG: type II toxin-antitoxin system HicB family antitoxin [Oscillospiraceae bacterium]|nr:type II toxin-antitoxin system HicB family antitoxin [Oscillospiraceae bacterium]